MRYVVIVGLLCGCNQGAIDAKDREIAELRRQLVEADHENAVLRAKVAACEPKVDPLIQKFASVVELRAVDMARAISKKPQDILDEQGHLRDPVGFAIQIRAATLKRLGKDDCYKALINGFGTDVGSAIFYERLGGPWNEVADDEEKMPEWLRKRP